MTELYNKTLLDGTDDLGLKTDCLSRDRSITNFR